MKDLLQKLLETDINQPVTLERILMTFAVTFLMGLLILVVYRITYKGVVFNRSFGMALLMVAMVTALVILPISSNIVLSLGMVGALSIVRFRTALKDPLDIVFMFWAIALGLTAGSGFYELAMIGCIILGLTMLLLSTISQTGKKKNYLLVVRMQDSTRINLQDWFPGYQLKSRTVTSKGVEIVGEIRLKPQDVKVIDSLGQQEGVSSVSLVRYSGD